MTLKVAVIGVRADGAAPKDKGIGFHHARIYHELSKEGYDISLVGISRTTRENADCAARIFEEFTGCKIHAYDDYREMLRQEKPEIVSICSPDECHLDNLEDVLASSAKYVMCEKPLATSKEIERAGKLLNLTKEKGILFAENLQLTSIREKLLNEEFNGIPYYELEDMPTDVLWETEGKKNGEIILDLCPHVFSLVKPKNGLSILESDEKSAWIESNLGYTNIKLMYTESGKEKKRQWKFFDTSTEIYHMFSYEWINGKPYIVYSNSSCSDNGNCHEPILIEDPLKLSIKRFIEREPFVGAEKGLENLIQVASILKQNEQKKEE